MFQIVFFIFTFSIDATNDIFHQGRMVNDAEKGDAKQNCVMKIVEVDNNPHLCIFATKDIEAGEELRYDYGVPNLPWRKVILMLIFTLSLLSQTYDTFYKMILLLDKIRQLKILKRMKI